MITALKHWLAARLLGISEVTPTALRNLANDLDGAGGPGPRITR